MQQPGQFRHLARVPAGEPPGIPGAAGLPDPADAFLALRGQGDQPGPAVGGVGLTGDEPEFLQRAQLAGHGGLADADEGGEVGGALAAALAEPHEQAVRGRLQVGVDLPGHLALVGPGPPQQDGQLPLQGQELRLVHTTAGQVGFAPATAAVPVFVHVSPCLDFPVLKVSATGRHRRSSPSISQA